MPTLRTTSSAVARAMPVVFVAIALLGAFVLWRGLGIARSAGAGPEGALGPLVLGALMALCGIAGAVVSWRGGARAATRDRLRAAHPGQPWAWREDWASGRIRGGGRSTSLAMLAFALFWCGVTGPVAWLFLSREIEDPNIYLVLVFPGAGVLVLIAAVRALLQARKHGASTFVLATRPGVVGRTLEGHVETSLQAAPPDGVDLRLTCERIARVRVATGRADRRQTRATVWEDHVQVEPLELLRGASGLRVPVAFEVPVGLPSSDEEHPYNSVVWQLSLSARLPGLDYTDTFTVPVFDTGAPPLTEAEREALRGQRRSRARTHVPATPLFRVTQTPRGGRVFWFTPRASAGAAVGAVVATLGFWAAVWWLLARGVTIGAAIVAFLAVLMTAGTIVVLFHRSSVEIEGGTVTLRHRILGLGTTRRFEARQVTGFRTKSVGEGNAQSWEVEVHTRDGGPYSAAAHFTSQRDADFVAEQLWMAMGGGA